MAHVFNVPLCHPLRLNILGASAFGSSTELWSKQLLGLCRGPLDRKRLEEFIAPLLSSSRHPAAEQGWRFAFSRNGVSRGVSYATTPRRSCPGFMALVAFTSVWACMTLRVV